MRWPTSTRGRWALAAALVPTLAAGVYAGVWVATGEPPFLRSGSGPEGPLPPSSPTASPTEEGSGPDGLSLEFSFAPDPLISDDPVRWSFVIRNNSDQPVTLTFPSGKEGDVVLTQGGAERYRWSDERFFTQAIRTVTIEPGQTHPFTLEGTLNVPPGTYALSAEVASDPPVAHAISEVVIGPRDRY